MNINNENSLDLLELYSKIETFLKFLDKEYKDASAELEK